jgi:hypothetical protein
MENENKGEIIIYQSDDGGIRLDVKLEDETVWLTQEQMALLFGKTIPTINYHINNLFAEGELNPEVVIRYFRITIQHGAKKCSLIANTVLDSYVKMAFNERCLLK